MARMAPCVMLLSAFLAFAARPAAQSSSAMVARSRASAPTAETALNKRVSLDLKAMAPRDAFKVIASAIGYTAEVAPDVSTAVDIVVGNISARTALNTICEKHRLHVAGERHNHPRQEGRTPDRGHRRAASSPTGQ